MTVKRGPGGIGKVGALGQSDLVSQIAAAITRQEGFYPGTPAYRNNNPGNLRPRPGGWPGQVRVDADGYTVFDSVASGTAALDTQIQSNINKGLTLQEFFAGKPGVYDGYAPAADSNQPNVYTAHVASWTGIDPTVPLISLVGSSQPAVSDAAVLADEGGDVPLVDSGTSTLELVALAAGVGLIAFVFWHR